MYNIHTMNRYRVRQIIISLLVVVLVVVSVVGLVRIARNLRVAGDTQPQERIANPLQDKDLSQIKVRMFFEGKINSREEHRSLRITVDADKRKFELLKGYNGEVLIKKEYKNDLAAFKSFVRAIDRNGILKAQKGTVGDDETAVCAKGTRVVFEVIDRENDQTLSRLWAVSCSKKWGTLAADSKILKELFALQIPEYDEFVRGVRF